MLPCSFLVLRVCAFNCIAGTQRGFRLHYMYHMVAFAERLGLMQ